MTIEELRVLAQSIQDNLLAVKTAAESGLTMTEQVLNMTNQQNPTSAVFNQIPNAADLILAAFSPDYMSMLTSLETAADALATDGLH